MKAFEYAVPRNELEALELLAARPGACEILAGGTDLVGLLRQRVATPERVVDIKEIPALRGIEADSEAVAIGACTTLGEMFAAPALAPYPAVLHAIRGINSLMLQAQGTLGGELCRRPRCWYFRNGYGLLGGCGQRVAAGENRFHAIFGNAGPAKFVHASRLAPALIALGARIRVVGPRAGDEAILPVEALFRIPRHEGERENALRPGQLLSHVYLPAVAASTNATYEVRHGAGPEQPLVSAAAALELDGAIVRGATIVLGQVAPIPWLAPAAVETLLDRPFSPALARRAGEAAVASATPLRDNAYKVRLARVAVERALLLAAGLPHGGF